MDINSLKDPQNILKLAKKIGAANIGYELVLSDNISADIIGCDEFNPRLSHPLKVLGTTIFFCLKASATYRINLSKHTVKAGQAMVILPGSIMQIIAAEDSIRFATISFANDYFDTIVDVSHKMRNEPVVNLSSYDFNECMDIYSRLKIRLSQQTGEMAKSIAKGYLKVICNIVIDNWRTTEELLVRTVTRPRELYNRFLTRVQEEYHTHRTVKYYADRLCVSPKYLSAVMKSESGRNASEFIDELVIMEAKALLAEGKYSAQQVSEMMNFPNPSFFARFFKKQCGLTPSEYRSIHSPGGK